MLQETYVRELDNITWYILDKCLSIQLQVDYIKKEDAMYGFKEMQDYSKIILTRIDEALEILNNFKQTINKEIT